MPSVSTWSSQKRKKQASAALALLTRHYKHAKIALHYSTSWELLVAVILSAQSTDKKVNEVTKNLFVKYKTLDDYVNADPSEFQNDIRPTGFYKTKTGYILECARIIRKTHDGIVPDTMRDLTGLPGIARKSANIILGNAYGKIEGVAVDTHVLRISQRLGIVPIGDIGGKSVRTFMRNGEKHIDFIKDASPEKIERHLMAVIPKQEWHRTTYRIIDHGRALCKSSKPKCSSCFLAHLCPAGRE